MISREGKNKNCVNLVRFYNYLKGDVQEINLKNVHFITAGISTNHFMYFFH